MKKKKTIGNLFPRVYGFTLCGFSYMLYLSYYNGNFKILMKNFTNGGWRDCTEVKRYTNLAEDHSLASSTHIR